MLASAALIAAPYAPAQQKPDATPLIGILEYGSSADFARHLVFFKEGLREGGFVEGRNLRIEYRFADYDYRKVNRLAEDLVRANVQLIYAPLPWAVHGAKAATSRIPIVFSGITDPVQIKFVQSYARPGGNITGVANTSAELTVKRMQLMREMFPVAGRLGIVYDEDAAKACQVELDELQAASKILGVPISRFPYQDKSDLAGIFVRGQKAGVAAVLVPTDLDARRAGAEFASQSASSRIPAVYSTADAVDAGGLMSYGPPPGWGPKRAAGYVARILKGTAPQELPVEMPSTYELVVNLKTARAMGVKVPQTIMLRADRVIE